jgi:arabinosaccharide transport system substrate-binding protein
MALCGHMQIVANNVEEETMKGRIIQRILLTGLAFCCCSVILAFGEQQGKQTVHLNFWTFMEVNKPYWEGRAVEFSNANPNVKLEISVTNYPYEEMHEKLLMATVSGSGGPDLCDVEIGKFGLFLRGNVPFYDLTDVLNQYKDKLLDIRLKAYEYKGKAYGFDYHLGAGLVYYNTELFAKNGLNVDDIKTWDDFIAAGKKITKDTNGDGKPDIWMTDVETNDLHIIKLLAMQRGGGVYNDKGDIILNSQPNIDAIKFLQDLVFKYKIARVAPGGHHFDASYFPWVNEGHVAAIIMPEWYMGVMQNNMPDLKGKIAVRPLPRVVPGGKRSGMSGGTATVIMKSLNPKYLAIAKNFLAFGKLTREAQVLVWTRMGYDPFRMDVYDDPELKKPLPYFHNEPVAQMIKELWLSKDIPNDNMGPYYPEVLEQLREKIPYRAFQNNEDPSIILNDAMAEVRSKMD